MYLSYIIILSVGFIILFFINKNSLIKSFQKSLLKNKLFFWLTMIIVLMLFVPYGGTNRYEGGDDLGVAKIVRLFGFAVLTLITFLYFSIKKMIKVKRSLYHFYFYIFFCFISAFYSPGPVETLWKSIELLGLLLLIIVLRNEIYSGNLSSSNILEGIIYLLLVFVILSLVGILLFPKLAMTPVIDGMEFSNESLWGIIPKLNPNSFAQFSAMLSFVGMFYSIYTKKSKTGAIVIIMVGLLGQFFAYSRTSMLAFVLVCIFLFILKKDYKLIFFGFIPIFIILFLQDNILEYVSRGQDLDQLSSLSGRTYMWQLAWESIQNNYLFGIGYYSGHKTLNVEIGMEFTSLDNTYIESLVDIGILGTFFLFLLVIKTFIRNLKFWKLIKKQLNFNWVILSLGFLVIMFVRSLTGPTFQNFNINLYFLLLLYISTEKRPHISSFLNNN